MVVFNVDRAVLLDLFEDRRVALHRQGGTNGGTLLFWRLFGAPVRLPIRRKSRKGKWYRRWDSNPHSLAGTGF